MKEKLENIWWKIKDTYKEIRCWFRYCFNKYKWRTVKEAIQGYPFDYGYLYTLQLRKLEEMLHYFEHSNIITDYTNIIKYIKISIELLHIIMDDGKGKYKDGLFSVIDAEKTDDHPFAWDLVSNVKVNHKNAKRFDAGGKWSDWDIYQRKALYLYHKILFEKSGEWWD